MNDGVNTTPEQAARSLRVVRLVSFGASLVVALVLLLAVATLRYAPLWPQPDPPRIAVISEVLREPEERMARAPPRPPPPRAAAQQQQLPPAPEPQPPAPSEPVIVTDPVWIERPRNPERFYPRQAFMQGVAGEVVLDCDVDTDGQLACAVVSETPPGQGFGDAALRIARAHTMRPAVRDGSRVRGRYRMVIPFSPSA